MIARARSARHAARPRQREETGWPGEGELDLEASLDAGLLRPDLLPPGDPPLRLSRDAPRPLRAAAILDMSLSMTGEKIALIAVAVAVLRIRLGPMAVVAFDSRAHRLVRAGADLPLREVVRRVLEVPAQGYTDIAAGLRAGAEELRGGRARERAALLLTDGVANAGEDPARAAAALPRLHVVQLGDYHPQGARCCREMAQAGRGRLLRAWTWADLPDLARRISREVFRR